LMVLVCASQIWWNGIEHWLYRWAMNTWAKCIAYQTCTGIMQFRWIPVEWVQWFEYGIYMRWKNPLYWLGGHHFKKNGSAFDSIGMEKLAIRLQHSHL
jgi:hypothetical protein